MSELSDNNELEHSIELGDTAVHILVEISMISCKYIFEVLEFLVKHAFNNILVIMGK